MPRLIAYVCALALAASVTTATFTNPPPFSLPSLPPLSSCNILPRQRALLGPPPLPPPRVDACSSITCPPPPSQCFEEAICVNGLCLPHLPKAFGTPCDDGIDATIGDVCGDGVCSGLTVSCPVSEVIVRPDTSLRLGEKIQASWQEPVASYAPGADIRISSNLKSGDLFSAGTHHVTYWADVNVPAVGTVSTSCMFDVIVYADHDPCTKVHCNLENACQLGAYCVVEGIEPVCKYDSLPLGLYRNPAYVKTDEDRKPWAKYPALRSSEAISCLDGDDWCAPKLSLLPKRIPRPPPFAPRFHLPKVPTVAATSGTPPVYTTTRAPVSSSSSSTNRVVPTTTSTAAPAPTTTATTAAPTKAPSTPGRITTTVAPPTTTTPPSTTTVPVPSTTRGRITTTVAPPTTTTTTSPLYTRPTTTAYRRPERRGAVDPDNNRFQNGSPQAAASGAMDHSKPSATAVSVLSSIGLVAVVAVVTVFVVMRKRAQAAPGVVLPSFVGQTPASA